VSGYGTSVCCVGMVIGVEVHSGGGIVTMGKIEVMRTSILQLQSFLLLRYLALSHDHEHNN
jgi:hypothetical protein